MKPIFIPQWLEQERPEAAEFLEVINESLEAMPDMTLAEFAKAIDDILRFGSMQRLLEAEKKQFGCKE